jgi:hypothetical protein
MRPTPHNTRLVGLRRRAAPAIVACAFVAGVPAADRSEHREVEVAANPFALGVGSRPLRYDAEYPSMHYATGVRTDAIAQLEARIAKGEVQLAYGKRGYLDSLLAALGIDPSSQALVFSQTSLQSGQIRPETPRAIYFNDDTYVAWVQRGPLEIAALDRNLGPVFYLLQNEPAAAEAPSPGIAFDRDEKRCLSCHDSYSMTGGGVPRFIVGSGYIGVTGNLVSHEGWILVTDKTPLKSLWGGWYVTGRHGKQAHLGNMLIRSLKDFEDLEAHRVGNIDKLDTLFDVKPYLSNQSDIVALLVLDHQTNAQNGITRVNYDVRTAIDRERGLANSTQGYEQPIAALSPALRKTVADAVEPLVATMLFSGAVKLTDPVTGDPRFTAQFVSRATRDPKGRSLRELDLQTRLFRYPMSYTVYSAAFEALPRAAREAVYARVATLLRAPDPGDTFATLRASDRGAILDILAATKPEFAAALRN